MDIQRGVEPAVDVFGVTFPNGKREMPGCAASHHGVEEGQEDDQRTDDLKKTEIRCTKCLQDPAAAE